MYKFGLFINLMFLGHYHLT